MTAKQWARRDNPAMPAEEMAALDALPVEVRRALAASKGNGHGPWSAASVLERMRQGATEHDMIQFLLEN